MEMENISKDDSCNRQIKINLLLCQIPSQSFIKQASGLTGQQLFDQVFQLTLLKVNERISTVDCQLCENFSASIDQSKEIAQHLYWKHEMKNRERILSMFNSESLEFTIYNLVDTNREAYKADHPAYCHQVMPQTKFLSAQLLIFSKSVFLDAKIHGFLSRFFADFG